MYIRTSDKKNRPDLLLNNKYQRTSERFGEISSGSGRIGLIIPPLRSIREAIIIHQALRRGTRNENKLTNLVFFNRHPELGGRAIKSHESKLANEWLAIRNKQVRPVLAKVELPEVQEDMRKGIRDENELTNRRFFKRYPDRGGAPISRRESNFKQLSNEWLHIRDKVVRLALAIPVVTRTTFRNKNTQKLDVDNCCKASLCVSTRNLGVGIDRGSGPTASNAMEMQFTLSGHRAGITYDIKRRRSNSLWERKNGVWKRLEFQFDLDDDLKTNKDECLIPKNNKIFVEDNPGYKSFVLPGPDGVRFPGVASGKSDRDATDVVLRFSFVESVRADNKSKGIPPTRISRFIPWHNIIWLTRNAAKKWVLNKAKSEIELGTLSSKTLNSSPK